MRYQIVRNKQLAGEFNSRTPWLIAVSLDQTLTGVDLQTGQKVKLIDGKLNSSNRVYLGKTTKL